MCGQARAQLGQDLARNAYALTARRSYEEVDRHSARNHSRGFSQNVGVINSRQTL